MSASAANLQISPIPWAPTLPFGWEARRLKFLFRREQRAPRDNDGVVTAFRDGQVALRERRRIDGFTNSLQEIGYQGVRRGDLVIHAMDAFAGAIGVSEDDGKSTPVYAVCTPKSGHIDARYYAVLLRHMALSGFVTALARGIRERSTEFRWADAGEVLVPLPSFPEQTAIVAFLDRETAKIDALVEQQRRLIELLKEKRRAIISHTVTKGLDPTAKMKPSGVEWLGDVPEHWTVAHIKRACTTITDGAHVSPDTEGGVYPFISTKDLDAGAIDFEACLLTSDASYQSLARSGCQPLPGDVLFSKDGTIGQTVVVREMRRFVVASSLIIIRPDSSLLDANYLSYLCQSSAVTAQVDGFVRGAGLPRLSIQNLLKVVGVIPPLADQHGIAASLDRRTSAFDRLTAEARHAIELLEERRSALISAAVTGKIDLSRERDTEGAA